MEGDKRWESFLLAGSRTSREFKWAWETFTTEAMNIWHCLGHDPCGALSAAVESAGGNNVDGSTRREVVEIREGLRHELVTWSLNKHPDRQARPVTAHQNIADDKVHAAGF